MEQQKKKTTRSVKKTTTKKKVVKTTPETEENAVEKVVESEEQIKDQPVREFNNDDLIDVKSVFAGSCTLVGRRTKNIYVWEELGEIQQVEFQDLLAEITNRYSKYIYEPLLLIEDEDVINKYPKLKELYDDMVDTDELTYSLLNDSVEDLQKILISLPYGLQETAKNLASTLMQEEELYDVRKIHLIDDLFGTALSEQLSLYR